MMKAGTETGSLTNHLMSRMVSAEPQAGMGVTVLCWTDRHPGTITRLTRTQVHVQRDRAERVDSNGMSENQEYKYTPDPNGITEVFRMTKRGWRNKAGNGLLIGHREKYYDFSF